MDKLSNTILPDGPITRIQASIVVTAYHNITIEDDQGTHFRLAIRNHRTMVWRTWNFGPNAGFWISRYIATHCVLR